MEGALPTKTRPYQWKILCSLCLMENNSEMAPCVHEANSWIAARCVIDAESTAQGNIWKASQRPQRRTFPLKLAYSFRHKPVLVLCCVMHPRHDIHLPVNINQESVTCMKFSLVTHTSLIYIPWKTCDGGAVVNQCMADVWLAGKWIPLCSSF